MEQVVNFVGWCFIIMTALGILAVLVQLCVRLLRRSHTPQIVGAELPYLDAGIDLKKRYDIAYGPNYGSSHEKLTGVKILGYLRSKRDETSPEYSGGGWLVVEMEDTKRAYIRPRSVLWLLEDRET